MLRPSLSACFLPTVLCSLACSASSAREAGPNAPEVSARESSDHDAGAAAGLPVPAGLGVRPGSSLPGADDLPSIEALPDPFAFADGGRVTSRADWQRRRSELIQRIAHYEYGVLPASPARVDVTPGASDAARDRQLTVRVSDGERQAAFTLRLRLPAGQGPFPTFIGAAPGGLPTSLNAERFLARGFAVVDVPLLAIAADDASRSGAFYTLYPETDAGGLAAWAWGFSRAVDALLSIPEVDGRALVVTGHSRYGKAALLASALDERFALTIPAASGLGGTSSFRFFYEADGKNEKIENITSRFPYWFSPVLRSFVGRPERLPFDQHAVMALIAPRLLLTTIGTEDHWANPRGAQVTHLAARRVYQFLGAPDRIAIHYRAGGHATNDEDFTAMMDYADLHFRGRKPSVTFDEHPFPDEPRAMPWADDAADPE
jgi:hypothetical protein